MEPMPGPIESLSAVTLVTRNMVDAVAFYKALGFGLAYGGPDAAFTCFRSGRSFLNLQLVVDAPAGGAWGRIIFWVDNVDAMHARAIAAGLHPLMAPADAPWGERYFHIRDCDGHELSFARRLAE